MADGNLYITAMEDGSGGYTSGRINTKQTAGFHPGMQVGGAGMGCAGGKGRVGWVKEAMQEGRGAFVCWWRAPQSAGRGANSAIPSHVRMAFPHRINNPA